MQENIDPLSNVIQKFNESDPTNFDAEQLTKYVIDAIHWVENLEFPSVYRKTVIEVIECYLTFASRTQLSKKTVSTIFPYLQTTQDKINCIDPTFCTLEENEKMILNNSWILIDKYVKKLITRYNELSALKCAKELSKLNEVLDQNLQKNLFDKNLKNALFAVFSIVIKSYKNFSVTLDLLDLLSERVGQEEFSNLLKVAIKNTQKDEERLVILSWYWGKLPEQERLDLFEKFYSKFSNMLRIKSLLTLFDALPEKYLSTYLKMAINDTAIQNNEKAPLFNTFWDKLSAQKLLVLLKLISSTDYLVFKNNEKIAQPIRFLLALICEKNTQNRYKCYLDNRNNMQNKDKPKLFECCIICMPSKRKELFELFKPELWLPKCSNSAKSQILSTLITTYPKHANSDYLMVAGSCNAYEDRSFIKNLYAQKEPDITANVAEIFSDKWVQNQKLPVVKINCLQ